MFEKTPELSPDIEWMLSSGQVDEVTLIEALIREHYRELFQLGLTLSDISLIAVIFAQQTLASAVLNAHQYKGKTSARVWLFRQALETWRHSSSQFRVEEPRPLESSLPPILEQRFGFNQAEIDTIMNGREAQSISASQTPGQSSKEATPPPGSPAETTENDGVLGTMPGAEPEPPLTDQEIAELKVAIQDEITKQRRSKIKTIRIQALAWTVIAILLIGILTRVYPLITAIPDETPTPTSITPIVARVENTANPIPIPSPTPLPPDLVVHTAIEGESLTDIARKYGVNLQLLARLNKVPEHLIFSAGQQLIIGRGSSRYTWTTTPTPFMPPDLPPPLTLDTDIQTIQKRVAESSDYWLTMWAEVQVSYYGPFSYIGPPKTWMHQTWLDQTINSTLTLTGDLSGDLERYELRTDYASHVYDFEAEERYITSQVGFTYAFSHEIHYILTFGGFKSQRGLRPGESLEEIFKIQTIDQVAGRDTLVLDWYSIITDQHSEPEAIEVVDQGRYWIDTQRGVVLRHQNFIPLEGDFERIAWVEYQVREIIFDAVFSYDLFEPYRQLPRRFVHDYHGEPLKGGEALPAPTWDPFSVRPTLAIDPPPANFDPATGQLSFHYQPDRSLVDIYSDGHYLGGVKTIDPLHAICARSPDGRLIAISYSPWWASLDQFTRLHWFDLQALNPETVTIPEISSGSYAHVTDFSFSPDSRNLAYFGCASETECAISLIDLETGEQHTVIAMRHAESLIWSPDGNYLALLGMTADSTYTMSKVLVIDLRSNELVYSGEVDPVTGLPAGDSPTHDWNGLFIIRYLTLDSCAFPPK